MFLLLKPSLLRKEGTLIQRLKFTCRPGQKSVFMASLLLLLGQEGCTVQEYFHSVLLNLACKTAQNHSDRKKIEQMNKAIPLAPWALRSPLHTVHVSLTALRVLLLGP